MESPFWSEAFFCARSHQFWFVGTLNCLPVLTVGFLVYRFAQSYRNDEAKACRQFQSCTNQRLFRFHSIFLPSVPPISISHSALTPSLPIFALGTSRSRHSGGNRIDPQHLLLPNLPLYIYTQKSGILQPQFLEKEQARERVRDRRVSSGLPLEYIRARLTRA